MELRVKRVCHTNTELKSELQGIGAPGRVGPSYLEFCTLKKKKETIMYLLNMRDSRNEHIKISLNLWMGRGRWLEDKKVIRWKLHNIRQKF